MTHTYNIFLSSSRLLFKDGQFHNKHSHKYGDEYYDSSSLSLHKIIHEKWTLHILNVDDKEAIIFTEGDEFVEFLKNHGVAIHEYQLDKYTIKTGESGPGSAKCETLLGKAVKGNKEYELEIYQSLTQDYYTFHLKQKNGSYSFFLKSYEGVEEAFINDDGFNKGFVFSRKIKTVLRDETDENHYMIQNYFKSGESLKKKDEAQSNKEAINFIIIVITMILFYYFFGEYFD